MVDAKYFRVTESGGIDSLPPAMQFMMRTPPTVTTCGFDCGRGFEGFGWRQEIDNQADDKADEIKLSLGVFENGRLCPVLVCQPLILQVTVQNADRADVLIERDADGKVTFCGGAANGVRDGLGMEITVDGAGNMRFRQGLWDEGRLTHIVSDGTLAPV